MGEPGTAVEALHSGDCIEHAAESEYGSSAVAGDLGVGLVEGDVAWSCAEVLWSRVSLVGWR